MQVDVPTGRTTAAWVLDPRQAFNFPAKAVRCGTHSDPKILIRLSCSDWCQSFYGRSRRRLLVFDYDGTLVAHHALAQLSAPPPGLLQVLEALCEVKSTSLQL